MHSLASVFNAYILRTCQYGAHIMKSHIVVALTALLAACQSTGPADNRQWMHVSCSGASDWTACWRQAEKLCPNGFDTANKEEDRVGLKREIDIACKR